MSEKEENDELTRGHSDRYHQTPELTALFKGAKTDALPQNCSNGSKGMLFSVDRLFHRRSCIVE
jgi:hypothetical protein